MSYKEVTKKSYEKTAKAFASNVADLAPKESIARFIKFLPEEPKIIDIGCGSGRDAKIFTEAGVDVVGIDFCVSLIDIAKLTAPLAEFHVMDIETLAFPANSFDGAWAACSLGHISKKSFPMVLQKIHSLLKDDGVFYLTLKKGTGEELKRDDRYGDYEKFLSLYEEDELKELLKKAKFTVLDFYTGEILFKYQTHPFLRAFCKKC